MELLAILARFMRRVICMHYDIPDLLFADTFDQITCHARLFQRPWLCLFCEQRLTLYSGVALWADGLAHDALESSLLSNSLVHSSFGGPSSRPGPILTVLVQTLLLRQPASSPVGSSHRIDDDDTARLLSMHRFNDRSLHGLHRGPSKHTSIHATVSQRATRALVIRDAIVPCDTI